MSSRSSSSSQYATNRSYMFHVSAFIASGRLNVIVAIWPSTSNKISCPGSLLTLALLDSTCAVQRCIGPDDWFLSPATVPKPLSRLRVPSGRWPGTRWVAVGGEGGLHNPLIPHPRHLVLTQPDLLQYLLSLLAQLRRDTMNLPRRLTELDRQPQQRNAAQHRVRSRDHHLPLPHLGMIQRPIHRVDRSGRYPRLVEKPLPLVDRPLL